jgi:hypothetical protein
MLSDENYCKQKGKKVFPTIITLFIIISTLLQACWAEKTSPLYIQNNTDQTLSIFITDIFEGNLAPKSTLKTEPSIGGRYDIVGKNPAGKIIYEKSISFEELDRMDWKILITLSDLNK